MRIGILQTGYVPDPLQQEHGEYQHMFRRMLSDFDFEMTNYKVVEMTFPESIHAEDGWLITGSAHGAYEDHAYIPPLEEFIRTAYDASVPTAGICFGHQIMAQALGGRVEKFAGGWGVGKNRYQTADGSDVYVNAMHQDQVVEKPPEGKVILTNDFCANAGLAYRNPALSFQPHPEFDHEFMDDLIRYKADRGLPQDVAKRALAELDSNNHSADIARQIGEFFLANRTAMAAE